MTLEDMNRAIAEVLGVKYHKPTDEEIKRGSYYQCEPNYTGSLDAMHEAALWLRKNGDQFQWLDYHKHLEKVVWPHSASSEMCVGSAMCWGIIEATATQRAEAFLRAVGRWQEKGEK